MSKQAEIGYNIGDGKPSATRRKKEVGIGCGAAFRCRKERMKEDLLFGKYRILQLLANGSGGEVFLALHEALGQQRVIKRLCKHQPFFEERKKEADILKQLHHAAIPRIYDVEEDEEALYIVEEYIEGETLKEVLFRQKCVPTTFILFYSIQLCEIIEYLHGQGILYLDIKPENLMIHTDHLSLIDFGGATWQKEHQGVSFGTSGYAAPEQYTGEAQERSDVYGIGCVMGIMLGKEAADDPKQKELRRIVSRCTEVLPAKRFKSVAQLKKELQSVSYKKQEKKPLQSRLPHSIGVLGVHEGADTAAFSMALAGYISEYEKGRVACIDLSGGEVFRSLYESLHGRKKECPKEFVLHGICFLSGEGKETVSRAMAKGYSVVVLSFGEGKSKNREEFLRCEKRFVVGDVYPWRTEAWENLPMRLLGLKTEDGVTALVSGGDAGELPIGFSAIKKMPRFSNLLHLDRKTERVLSRLVK